MSLQVESVVESFFAPGARISPDGAVALQMACQHPLKSELLAAMRALERRVSVSRPAPNSNIHFLTVR